MPKSGTASRAVTSRPWWLMFRREENDRRAAEMQHIDWRAPGLVWALDPSWRSLTFSPMQTGILTAGSAGVDL